MSTTASARSHTGAAVVDALLARDDAGETLRQALGCPPWCVVEHGEECSPVRGEWTVQHASQASTCRALHLERGCPETREIRVDSTAWTDDLGAEDPSQGLEQPRQVRLTVPVNAWSEIVLTASDARQLARLLLAEAAKIEEEDQDETTTPDASAAERPAA